MYPALKFLIDYLPSRSERGQDLAEYGLLMVLIAILIIVVILLIGNQIAAVFTYIVDHWPP